MKGDDGDEDNDFDQQPLPRLTTYKEAGYSCFGRCVLFLNFGYIGHGHEALSVSSIANIDKIVN